MSTIRIFSKKAFAFGPGAVQGSDVIENFFTFPGTFQDMPDKYQNDLTFKMAVKYKEVEIVQHEVQVQAAPKIKETVVEPNPDPDDSVEKFYEELKLKNKDEVKELAVKYGAEFIDSDPLKINKKRVMEAYKLSISEE